MLLAVAYLTLGIIGYIFIFSRYSDYRKDDSLSFEPFYSMAVSSGCGILFFLVTFMVADELLVLVSFLGLFGTWIWNWIIIADSTWDIIDSKYHGIWQVTIALQATTSFAVALFVFRHFFMPSDFTQPVAYRRQPPVQPI